MIVGLAVATVCSREWRSTHADFALVASCKATLLAYLTISCSYFANTVSDLCLLHVWLRVTALAGVGWPAVCLAVHYHP